VPEPKVTLHENGDMTVECFDGAPPHHELDASEVAVLRAYFAAEREAQALDDPNHAYTLGYRKALAEVAERVPEDVEEIVMRAARDKADQFHYAKGAGSDAEGYERDYARFKAQYTVAVEAVSAERDALAAVIEALSERDAKVRAEVIDWIEAMGDGGSVYREAREHFGLTKGADDDPR